MPLHAPIRPLRRLRGSVVAASCAALLCTAGFLPTAHAAGRQQLMGSRPAHATPATDAGTRAVPRRPFVLVAQQYLADPGRSAGDIHPVWAYAHVPHGYDGDATAAVLDRIEQ
ncbi:hypothetical protein [Streptomyces sp. NPDC014006]|uniref:hypothetical protein n=1 Tax=Streptomyces sp. NPDC014006 TaxID=3364870 RepID=UPI0036F8C500